MESKVVLLSQIDFGDRRRVQYGDLTKLANTIKKHGLIQPLAVQKIQEGEYERFLLLAGGRRYRACEEACITEVPVRVYNEEMDEFEKRSIELIENVEREALTWQEEAALKSEVHTLHCIKYGVKQPGRGDKGATEKWTVEKTAELFGESQQNTQRDINLAAAIKDIPELQRCKTKGEAQKALAQMQETLVLTEMLKRQKVKVDKTPLAVQRVKLQNAFINKDCLEGMKDIQPGTIDLVEIDPPYFMQLANVDGIGYASSVKGFVEVEKDNYYSLMEKVAKACYRAMKPDAWVMCWFSTQSYTQTKKALEEAGLFVEPIPVVWVKTSGETNIGNTDTQFAGIYENFFYAKKGAPILTKKAPRNVFLQAGSKRDDKMHPYEKPLPLLEEIFSIFVRPGAQILSPFLGSGNSILAAANKGMTAFGYELSSEYKIRYDARVMLFVPKTILGDM